MTAAFFLLFSWFMVTAKTRRQVVAVTLVGTVAAALVAPRPVMAQAKPDCGDPGGVECHQRRHPNGAQFHQHSRSSRLSNFYQTVIWPVNLINQARAQVTQMINQYRKSHAEHLQHQLAKRNAGRDTAVGDGHAKRANVRTSPH